MELVRSPRKGGSSCKCSVECHEEITYMTRRCFLLAFSLCFLLLAVAACSDNTPTKPKAPAMKDEAPPAPRAGGKSG